MEIKIENLSFSYDQRELALEGINLEVRKGEVLGIIGNTGSGKSTLLKHLNAIFKSPKGEIEILGRKIYKESKKLRDIRRDVGVVFQFPEEQLFAQTIKEDIYFGPNNFGYTPDEIDKTMNELKGIFDFNKELLEKNSAELSGGEKRRVSIGSIVISRPKVLVLDEPTIGLDYENRKKLMELIEQLNSRGTTVVIVSHDIHTLWPVFQRVILLHEGKKVFEGDRKKLLENKDDYMKYINFLPDYVEKLDELNLLKGNEERALTKEGCMKVIMEKFGDLNG